MSSLFIRKWSLVIVYGWCKFGTKGPLIKLLPSNRAHFLWKLLGDAEESTDVFSITLRKTSNSMLFRCNSCLSTRRQSSYAASSATACNNLFHGNMNEPKRVFIMKWTGYSLLRKVVTLDHAFNTSMLLLFPFILDPFFQPLVLLGKNIRTMGEFVL